MPKADRTSQAAWHAYSKFSDSTGENNGKDSERERERAERYPLHLRAAYVPDASRWSVDLLIDYLRQREDEGIDRAVLVHPEPYGDDPRLVLDCLERCRIAL